MPLKKSQDRLCVKHTCLDFFRRYSRSGAIYRSDAWVLYTYRFAPMWNSATVPGPEWAPMVGLT